MKKTLLRITAASASLCLAAPVVAHTGKHDTVGVADTLSHVIAHADHLAPVLALMAIALVVFAANRRKPSTRR